MPGLRYALHTVMWLFRGVQVFALVGKSGSGKSFRAQLIAQKHAIEVIVDDGLLIKGQKILAGRSAKRERGGLSAVKTALFHDDPHAREVRRILEHTRFRRILILGTSERMARRIAERLGLPHPRRIIQIEEVATQEEIQAALHQRRTQGRHIIPVPPIEVKRDYPHIVIDSIKIFLRNNLFRTRGRVFEKTVVNPQFDRRGNITVSEAALTQMVLHCVGEFEPDYQVERLVVTGDMRQPGLEVVLRVQFGTPVAGRLHQLRDYIIASVEQFSGLLLSEVDVTLGDVGARGGPRTSGRSPPPTTAAAAVRRRRASRREQRRRRTRMV